MGLINHYYFYRLRDEMGAGNFHAKLSLFAPRDPGYVEDISGAAILKSSKHQAAAQKFLAFLTSAAGQRVLADSTSFEYPLAKGVAPNPALPPFSSTSPTRSRPRRSAPGSTPRTCSSRRGCSERGDGSMTTWLARAVRRAGCAADPPAAGPWSSRQRA